MAWVFLSAGQGHDITEAHNLVANLNFEALIADRAYGAQDFIDELLANGIEVVIPSKSNATQPREYDIWRYRERHLVDCFIGASFRVSTNWPSLSEFRASFLYAHLATMKCQ